MNIHEALDWRYAVREFSPEKLDAQTVETLVDAARKSASSYGLQPYKILVVESKAVRRDLLAYSFGQQKVLDCSHLIVFAAHADIGDHTVDRYVTQFVKTRGVPVEDISGYVSHMKQALAAKSRAEKQAWAHQQAYIALGTLLTAAASMRIDSCPMTGFDHRAYDEVLGLAELGLESSAIVALGYRSARDRSSGLPKVRFDYDDLVIWM
ncbi:MULTISPECIES: NAD(P)H-dependent oxidoreductase [unclassified Marinobacter]|jgi:nitroreductase|uniref:NAD(P)H-dependent oxidoreductase n=1 Tax=unclassified Marinobacter TaxID=83889 RepID=UPI001928E286|nr:MULTISPECIES: NAD(P)H-dependent oxidoreductase [unclassified Marinobacter]MBL3826688.1 NAD(P)H-dependent oxidoreductase [Marinobacter sp. MC3]MBL3895103.1 NAD(P)H-dependent oxidoreductase [Marinobacter sp. MW3]